MKTLVVFYSRSGNTRTVGQEIAGTLKADLDEIIDTKDRSGIFGWLRGGRDAMRKISTAIKVKKSPEKYDLVVIGTPIWAWTLTPAVRIYLSTNKLRKVAFFCTSGGSKGTVFRDMEKLSSRPLATLELIDSEIARPESRKAIASFCRKLAAK
jgi:flavodoxin